MKMILVFDRIYEPQMRTIHIQARNPSMKRKVILSTVALLIAVLLCACNPVAEDQTTGSTKPPIQRPPAKPSTSSPSVSTPAATVPPTSQPAENTFEEIVLADNDDILFKITGVENDPIWGYSLNVYIENRTEAELMFSIDDVSVNGFMCDPFWADSVTAGKKSNSSISWFESNFAENGITDVEEIVFTLRVYDCNDFTADDVLLQTFTIAP